VPIKFFLLGLCTSSAFLKNSLEESPLNLRKGGSQRE